MSKQKPLEYFDLPMPSADEDQKFYRKRFRMRVSTRLEPAVIQTKGAGIGDGDLQLACFLSVKIFHRDRLESAEAIRAICDDKLGGLAPEILKAIQGIYLSPSGEELPMVNVDGNSVRMPFYFIDPDYRGAGKYPRSEDFPISVLARFLQNSEFRPPHQRQSDGSWNPFRQAVGSQMTQASSEDEGKHVTKRVFSGTVFGRLPEATVRVVEIEGKRCAQMSGNRFLLGYAAFMPSTLINELLRMFLGVEPFYQNLVHFYSGFRMREEVQAVRGLLAAPREEHKVEAKAERRSETLDERVARLTIELTEHEQKAEAAKGTPGEAKANQKLGAARGRLTQAKAQLEKKVDESSEAPAPPAPAA